MKRLCLMASTLLVLLEFTVDLQAQVGHPGACQERSLRESFYAGYRANVDWPKHYIPAARQPLCHTFAVMIDNGWRRQNLLGDHHFKSDSSELTEAGKLKVRWILSQAPRSRRGIYVQRGVDVAQTSARIAAVQANAASLSPAVKPAFVSDTHIVPEGHPAGVVDNVFVGFQNNRPAPVLPKASKTGAK